MVMQSKLLIINLNLKVILTIYVHLVHYEIPNQHHRTILVEMLVHVI